MTRCVTRGCGSYAINHSAHGRDGSDGDLCDVCYWRKRAGGLPGWALVPVEPTPAMYRAGAAAIDLRKQSRAQSCWAAMLRAAPATPTASR